MSFDNFDSEMLERIAAALEGMVEGQTILSKQIERFLNLNEAKSETTFEAKVENVRTNFARLVALHQEKTATLEENFGKSFAETINFLLSELPSLLHDACETERFRKLMLDKEKTSASALFDKKIFDSIAPRFADIRNFMLELGPEANSLYEKAREEAIVIVSKEGLWSREQMGTINLIRYLFDGGTNGTSSSLEQLLIVWAAVRFIVRLLANTNKS